MNRLNNMNRRRFLQGTGIALTLPAFESFSVRAVQGDKSSRRLVCVGNHLGFYPGNFFPKDAGKDYTSTSTLKPLERHRDDLTVFSHLDHEINGGHKAVQGFLTSIKKEEAAGFPEKNISLDQAAAEHVGSATRFPSINAGIQQGTDMCWTRAGVHVPPVNNPATLFRGLFVNSPASEREVKRTRLKHRGSVLDALRDSASALNRTLNAADRDKLDQYLTSVRDVERRLQMSKEWLDRPKPKSPIEEVKDEERQHIDEVALFYDLMALALQTDSTRFASFMLESEHSSGSELWNYATYVLGYKGATHDIAHKRPTESGKWDNWRAKQHAYFLQRLRNTPEGDSNMLDQTVVVWGSAHPHASHNTRNYPIQVAGGDALGFKHGNLHLSLIHI